MITTPYLKVILNSEAEIVEFECDLFEGSYLPEEVIGKNWFELFIHPSDKDKVMQVFKGLFDGKEKVWQSYKNDIVCKSGQYKLVDFHNQIFERDDVQYVNSVGIEHFINSDTLLDMVADKLCE